MITFQDKVSINTDPSIADINKIKDSDINALKNGVNTNETNISNIKSAMAYSTTEVKTDKVWIDGKPIYTIVFNYQTPSSTTNNSVSIDVSGLNVDNFINIYGFSNDKNFIIGGNTQAIGWNTAKTSVMIYFNNSSALSYKGYAIIEYTKTTDVAP